MHTDLIILKLFSKCFIHTFSIEVVTKLPDYHVPSTVEKILILFEETYEI